MKICYFFSNIYLGKTTGQSGIALSLIKKAQELGYEVYIVSNYENQQNNFDIDKSKRFLIKGPSTLKTYLLNSYKIIKYLKKVKPDIIHVQGHLLIPFVYFLNKLVGSRIIYILPERIDCLDSLFRYLIISSIKNIGVGFVLSQCIKKQLVQWGIPEDRIFVAHIGLREAFLKQSLKKVEYEYDILYYGDADEKRGFDVLYNLAKRLPNLKFKLLIRWSKNYQKRLTELRTFKNASILQNSCFEELKLKQLILKSKLVVLPYRWMGVQPPLTLVEAMALGKCVLTSALPCSKELIIDNENAVLIDPDGPINEIIKKIEFLLNNLVITEKIGREANKTILKNYSSSEYNKVFIAYEMIVNDFYEWQMFGNVGGYFVSEKEINVLLDLLQPKADDKILDVGTGSGRFAKAIVKNSKAEIIGLDPDKRILEEGKKTKQIFLSEEEERRYKCIFGDGHNLPFADNKFDKVYCFRVLKYYQDPWRGIDELIRVLKPGGILVLEIISNQSWESIARYFLRKPIDKTSVYFWTKSMVAFNPGQVKKYLLSKGMVILEEKPLHKVPPLVYSKLQNKNINYFLEIIDKILLKTTPKYLFSKSIIFKCKKE